MAATQATNRSLSHHHHLKTTTMATHHLPHHQQLPTHRPRMAEVNTLPTSTLPTPPTRHHAITPCPATLPTRTTDRPASRHRHHPATQTTMKFNQHHHLQPPRKHSSTLNLSTPHLQDLRHPRTTALMRMHHHGRCNLSLRPRPPRANCTRSRRHQQRRRHRIQQPCKRQSVHRSPQRRPPTLWTERHIHNHLKSQSPRHVPE